MFLLLIGGGTVQFTIIYSTQMLQIWVKICLFD